MLSGNHGGLANANAVNIGFIDFRDHFHGVDLPQFKDARLAWSFTLAGMDHENRAVHGRHEDAVAEISLDALNHRQGTGPLSRKLLRILATLINAVAGYGPLLNQLLIAQEFAAAQLKASGEGFNLGLLGPQVCLKPGVVVKDGEQLPLGYHRPFLHQQPGNSRIARTAGGTGEPTHITLGLDPAEGCHITGSRYPGWRAEPPAHQPVPCRWMPLPAGGTAAQGQP